MIHNKDGARAGFTLTEIIAVLAVISLFAAIAVPTMIHFIERGHQMNRANIARTVYLAAQNRLTELRITKNLKAELTSEYYDANGQYIEDALLNNKNVYKSLGNYLPEAEIANGNEKYVHYLSKAKGVTDSDDPVIKLLDSVIMDKSILNDAILIEYNIRTGVVLSVFYGDTVTGAFDYDGTNADSSDPHNVFGKRGMDADESDEDLYTFAEPRTQGYYGVTDTNTLDESMSTLIKVYDSYSPPVDASLSREYANMLCAEILIPEDQLDGSFDLLINGIAVESGVSLSKFQSDSYRSLSEDAGISGALIDYAAKTDFTDTALLYRYDGDIEDGYARIIWVLDYVGGDMAGAGGNKRHSIDVKYGSKGAFSHDQNLRVGIQGGAAATSFTEAHPYFLTESKSGYSRNQYTVMSARHLYNIRYVATGNFRQADDIVVDAAGIRSVNNFAPIPAFQGTYTAAYSVNGGDMQSYVIWNLTVNVPEDNVGLFQRIDGEADPLGSGESRASVVGLTLENPSITGRYNVGPVCGSLNGFITGIYVRYTDGGKAISGTGNVGGIAGMSENKGTVTDSTFLSPTEQIHISVTDAGAAGGIVGYNNGGTIKRALFLARAPRSSGTIYPIVGTGLIPDTGNQLYYLSGVAKRPTDPANYNTEPVSAANDRIDVRGLGTAELNDTVMSADWYAEELTNEQATDLAGTVYPYPYSRFSAKPVAELEEDASNGNFDNTWPVVDGFGDITFSNIAYYEAYANNTYGLWFASDGQGGGTLKNDQVITEAGYAVILDEKLASVHHFFAGVDGLSWTRMRELDFDSNTAAEIKISAAAKLHDAWKTKTDIWSFILPLDKLTELEQRSAPLRVMYTLRSDGQEPRQIDGYLQPLFAKGLYRTMSPTEFFVRTPLQMQNISVLTAAGDTNEKTFTQELALDYSKTGIGVNVTKGDTTYSDLAAPAVSGAFQGVYQGKAINNVTISVTDTGGSASLFVENQGQIKDVRLIGAKLTGNNGAAFGIALTNTGSITGTSVENSEISGQIGMASGIVRTNKGTITGTSVENSKIISQNSAASGIAAENEHEISACKVSGGTVSASAAASGVTQTNTGLVKGTSVENVTVTSTSNGAASGIAAENEHEISTCKVSGGTVSSSAAASGVTQTNTGSVKGTSVEGVKITGQNGMAAGIAGTNNHIIDSCKASGVTLYTSASAAGGVAGLNSGTISNTTVEKNSRIESQNNAAGGVAGINNGNGSGSRGVIAGCTVSQATVSGNSNIGGAAGRNEEFAIIRSTNVKESTITGGSSNNVGGVAGLSGGEVADCMVITVTVSTSVNNVGGVVGNNSQSGEITRTGVEYSTVKSDGSSIGGIAGSNSGTITDVFFLSTGSPEKESGRPVSDSGGGIAGSNSGDIVRALYLAPAPLSDSGSNAVPTFYPVVRSGNEAEDSFYLSGYRYSLNEGKNWTTSALPYNRLAYPASFDVAGGSDGLVTRFYDKEWLAFIYLADLEDWSNWAQPARGYPYPVLKNGMTVPTKWPETDSPIRRDQVDTDEWTETLPTSNRALNLDFVNGDFTTGNFNTLPVVDDPGGNRRLYVNMKDVNGWYTRPVNASDFSANFQGNQGNSTQSWRLIELQEPINITGADMLHEYAYSNYLGNWSNPTAVRTSQNRYAELNAEVQGTLYQVSPTTPGAQFYYSFYHTSRTGGSSTTATDRMNFYLTGIDDKAAIEVTNATELAARDGALTLIRPCWSPRTSRSSRANLTNINDSRWNTTASNTVAYGTGFDLSYHRGRSYLQPGTAGNMVVQDIPTTGNVRLYDVWIGSITNNTRTGYGITFWSRSNRSLATSGYASLSALNAVAPEALTNTIGYWGVEYGWKYYYGLYTVPEGQSRTEFAFRSQTNNPTIGNYLDGISFKSPAFLSIDKFIKMNNVDVKFVKPGDILTVELNVQSWGEVAADNIVITDRLAPFTEYIEFVSGSAKLNGNTISSSNVSYEDGIVEIKLPSTRLKTNEKTTVTFNIKVRSRVLSQETTETLLYYFRNQAVVEYCQDQSADEYKLTGYKNKIHTNGSGPEPVQVFIDPIKLSKTVTTVGNASANDPLTDGPFKVTLAVENTLEAGNYITTSGLITDVIPEGFTLYDEDPPPPGTEVEIEPNADGTTRIVIRNVGLDQTNKRVEYSYKLEYTGDGYGVAYTNASADYKYRYQDGDEEVLSVMLKFPQPVVGITVETKPDTYVAREALTRVYEITSNDNFAKKLADDNYDVTPEIILTDQYGNPVEGRKDGNYWIDDEFYTALLAKGSNNLEFTPKLGLNNTYKLYYKIELNAAKTGGTPPSFALSSEVTEITFFVTDIDTLVYYEQYADDTYGFYAGESAPVPQALDNTKKVIESGYGVLSVFNDKKIQLGDKVSTVSRPVYVGAYLYTLDADAVSDTVLREVKFGDATADEADMEVIGKIHPNFAKAVYEATEADVSKDQFSIRTPQQMWNISLLTNNAANATENVTFTQERTLDFSALSITAAAAEARVATAGTTAAGAATAGTTAAGTATAGTTEARAATAGTTGARTTGTNILDNSVVTGEFKGTFEVAEPEDGIPYTIKNVIIKSEETNVGLFSHNSGTIKGIALRLTTDITGGDNVGGIAGYNQGLIEACTVEGWEDAVRQNIYIGMHIEGHENVGGIAGQNDGEIKDCSVRYSNETIKGYDYVGGIAGLNTATGIISGAVASDLRLEYVKDHGEVHVGELVGHNDGGTYSGTATDVEIEWVEEEDEEETDETGEAEGAAAEVRKTPPEDEDKKEPEEPLDMNITNPKKDEEDEEESDEDDEASDDEASEDPDDPVKVATAGTTA